jgi:hypothetical protein
MTESSPRTLLWRLNQEYIKRLASARTYLGLLLELVSTRGSELDADLPPLLAYTHDTLTRLHDEHRHWRYTYFYESSETKRVVQSERALHRAMAQFSLMRTRHDRLLREMTVLYDAVPAPPPDATSVVNANLWGLFRTALDDLLHFDLYAQNLQ